jgi:hypothetical protein
MASQPFIDISATSIDKLPVSEEVRSALKDIQAEVADAYRDGFVEMVQALRQQASILQRINNTLAILVENSAPQLKGKVPAAIRIASAGESPDIASAVVVADPIGSGYYLSQCDAATALRIGTADASVLFRAFKLPDDGDCAVVVRRGKKELINYHSRVLDRFREMVRSPPVGLNKSQQSALSRVRRAMSPTKI